MSTPVLTYSPEDVTIILCGYTLGGILSIELRWQSRPFTFHRGIRNVHTRTFNKDMCATIHIEVMQTSVTNDVMSQILTQDRRNKSARLDVTVQDVGGTTMYQANQAYIPAYPNVKFSRGFETRIWEIEIFDLTDAFVGGNSRAGFDLFSSVDGALDFLGGAVDTALDTVSNTFDQFTQ